MVFKFNYKKWLNSIDNKRLILLICIPFILIFCITFLVSKKNTHASNIKPKTNSVISKKENIIKLSTDSSKCITYQQNDYFKKYVFKFNNYNDIKWEENKNYVFLSIPNNEQNNINVFKDDKTILNDIIGTYSSPYLIIAIKKINPDENFVYNDLKNNNSLVVLISKNKNPYKYKVVIDPGHGGFDCGTNLNNLYEKDLTLKISMYMKYELIYNGCKVYYTRESDISPNYTKTQRTSLKARTDLANDNKADVFVSVHINSFTSGKYNGVSAYYYCPNKYQLDLRKKLAQSIQDEITKSDSWYDRLIQTSNLYVLRCTKMPSVLVECGFITNKDDFNKLKNDDVLKNLGINISSGILNFLKSEH